ncbi:hypothetical protein ACF0H5_006761 [Mactra antiquata]
MAHGVTPLLSWILVLYANINRGQGCSFGLTSNGIISKIDFFRILIFEPVSRRVVKNTRSSQSLQDLV